MEYRLSCGSVFEDEQYYWFAELQFNGFYKVDKSTKKAELLFHFPEEDLAQHALFGAIKKVGDWFVFTPAVAKNIVLYNLKTEDLRSLPLKEVKGGKKISYNKNRKFSSVFIWGDSAYFIPNSYPAIVKLNLETFSLTYITKWLPGLERVLPEELDPRFNVFFGRGLVQGSTAILPCGCTNHVLLLNLENNSTKLIELESKASCYNAVAFDGTDFWLTPRFGGYLTKWNQETELCKTIEIGDTGELQRALFNFPLVRNSVLYLSALNNSHPYQVDLTSEVATKMEVLDESLPTSFELPNMPASDMFCSRIEGNQYAFISGRDRRWYQMDLDTQEISSFEILADEAGIKIMQEKNLKAIERPHCSIPEFCQFLYQPESNQKIAEESQGTIGEAVFRATAPTP